MLKGSKRVRLPAFRMPKVVRNIMVSTAVLLLLIIGGGAGYVYMSGGAVDEADLTPVAETTSLKSPVEPKTPPPDAKVGASVQSFTTPVAPGANTSINIRTLPEAECTIKVEYNKVPAADSGLMPKIANEYGMVSWTWTVAKGAPVGKWPVDILCTRNENSGAVQAKLEVKL